MTVYSNKVRNLTVDINGLLHLKGLTNTDFFNDIDYLKKNKKTDPLASINFQNKYIQLFDGTIREFGKTSGRPIVSFLASVRVMTNPKHYIGTNDPLIIKFNNEFRKKTVFIKPKAKKVKPLNVQLALTKFHGYYSDRLIKGSPVNFLKKYVIIYRFKQNKIGKIGFESGNQIVDNYPIIQPLIKFDLTILNNFFKNYYGSNILAYSYGFLLEFELYDSKTQKYSDSENISQRTLISVSNTMIDSEQLSKLKIVNDRFMNILAGTKGTNLHYYIFKSRIMITFYVPLKQVFTF